MTGAGFPGVLGSDIGIWIDFGKDEPDMTLQREYREGNGLVWRGYLVDGEPVKAPIDVEALPPGNYRLV